MPMNTHRTPAHRGAFAGAAEPGKSRYVYGILTLLLGTSGLATAYLGKRPALVAALALLTPCCLVFLPWEYLRLLLLALAGINLIRAFLVYAGMGYVGTHAADFMPLEQEDHALRLSLLGGAVTCLLVWITLVSQLVAAVAR